jgi:glutamate carboxypeptidase
MGLEPMGELDPAKTRRGRHQLCCCGRRRAGRPPAADGEHAPGERVDIDSIWRQAKRAAVLMSRLAAEKR